MPSILPMSRRRFLMSTGAAAGLAAASSLAMPSLSRAQSRPAFAHGVQTGDVGAHSGMVWTRPDRASKVAFEWATTEGFEDAVRLAELDAVPGHDFAVKRLLADLPADQQIFWRARATDLTDANAASDWIVGNFRTAPTTKRSIRFGWSGDTAGQGWGIDESRGGMKTYATMGGHDLDFFIHSGDTVYADGPLVEEVELKDGSVWKNIVTPEKSKVAETLEEFRGQWKYNLMDANLRAFNASVPTFFQWDDHEVVNNWSLSKDLTADDRYSEKNVLVLAARAAQAFHEMTPISYVPEEPGRIYRTINYGPLVDIFFLDMRSYRGPNGDNVEASQTPETDILGARQVEWLKGALKASQATWKIIAADMPLGLIVWNDGANKRGSEAIANGDDGLPKGREMEIAGLLRFIRDENILNTVWLTADVHYTAAHHYSPDRAEFQDFAPFWEFVSGPIHSGTFGPGSLDKTFGPEARFVKAPSEEQGQNLSPAEDLQFFGLVEIDGESEALTVKLMDWNDTELWSTVLEPERRA